MWFSRLLVHDSSKSSASPFKTCKNIGWYLEQNMILNVTCSAASHSCLNKIQLKMFTLYPKKIKNALQPIRQGSVFRKGSEKSVTLNFFCSFMFCEYSIFYALFSFQETPSERETKDLWHRSFSHRNCLLLSLNCLLKKCDLPVSMKQTCLLRQQLELVRMTNSKRNHLHDIRV